MKIMSIASLVALAMCAGQLHAAPNSAEVIDSEGSVVKMEADGTKTIKKKDGTFIQVKPDGTKTIKENDGTSVEVKPNGTKLIKKADGTFIEVNPRQPSTK